MLAFVVDELRLREHLALISFDENRSRSQCPYDLGEVDSRRRALLSNRYETLRADRSVLCARRWDYVVLDEGHVIRNAKSKLALASKALSASYVEIAVYL